MGRDTLGSKYPRGCDDCDAVVAREEAGRSRVSNTFRGGSDDMGTLESVYPFMSLAPDALTEGDE